ncbi:hypothetical protein [Candidatus Tisiphia endosymbiont of Hybos culiciformis]|uniref:hypothetical protein n=1 Tax=Candidatus Tisiphia endosymbiont of Hybos culiciformis TaxID=3139331 RepID=UPI003CCB114C
MIARKHNIESGNDKFLVTIISLSSIEPKDSWGDFFDVHTIYVREVFSKLKYFECFMGIILHSPTFFIL